MIIGPMDGIDQPIIEKDDLCIFETETGYVIRKEGEGDVMELDKLTDDMIKELKNRGWEESYA